MIVMLTLLKRNKACRDNLTVIQTWMSVVKGHTIVMKMPPVLMWLEDSTVPVTLDSLGMVPSVRVRMTSLLVS